MTEQTVPADQPDPPYADDSPEVEPKNPETAPAAADDVKVPGDALPDADSDGGEDEVKP
jgi:hypothetical protein